MCGIVDANVANEVFGTERPPAGEHFFDWLTSPRGQLVVGGKLLQELDRSRGFRRWMRTATRYGRARTVSDDDIEARGADLRRKDICRCPKSSPTETGPYFTEAALLSPPLTRPAYSDRMAYVLAEMSDLAYYQFEGPRGFVDDAVENAMSLDLTDDTNVCEFLEKFSTELMSGRRLQLGSMKKVLSNSGFSLLDVIDINETQGFACKRIAENEPPICFRWTRNDAGLGLVNSRTAEVAEIRDGRVTFRLEDGRKLELDNNDPQLRHLDHAWASTVHAFQGRTVDNVIAAMKARHPHLTTQKSFYVEISRARDRAELITDDAAELKAQLQAVTGERIAALEGIVEMERAAPEKAAEAERAIEGQPDRGAGQDQEGPASPSKDREPPVPERGRGAGMDLGL